MRIREMGSSPVARRNERQEKPAKAEPRRLGHFADDQFERPKARPGPAKPPKVDPHVDHPRWMEATARGMKAGEDAARAGKPLPMGPPAPMSSLKQAEYDGFIAGYVRARATMEGEKLGYDAAKAGQPPPTPAEGEKESAAIRSARQAGVDQGYRKGRAEVDGYQAGYAAGREGREKPPAVANPGDSPEVQAARQGAIDQGFGVGQGERAAAEAAAEAARIAEEQRAAEAARAQVTEAAIGYAMDPPRNPIQGSGGSWYYYCLGLTNLSYQAAGKTLPELQSESARDAFNQFSGQGRIRTDGTPPRGAIVFFDRTQWGHVGISLGDGTFVGTASSGRTNVEPIAVGDYMGWVAP